MFSWLKIIKQVKKNNDNDYKDKYHKYNDHKDDDHKDNENSIKKNRTIY